MASTFTTTATINSFGGQFLKLTHQSTITGTPMNLTLYLPSSAAASRPAPLLIYLSGLTSSPDNHESWDFGSAASFYIDAITEPWNKNYKMESYLTKELPDLLFGAFTELDSSRVSIAGHSMGGHGALTLYLKNPGKYKSVSAFAPIVNPVNCPWGQKVFSGYLGDNKEEWKKHDASELLRSWKGPLNALIDVGTEDNFYKQGQLFPENFEKVAEEVGASDFQVNYRGGYDHSYFFISTFASDHIQHAAKALGLL
ncbi:family 1 carbohydrate esterase [Trichoderma velutinum]